MTPQPHDPHDLDGRVTQLEFGVRKMESTLETIQTEAHASRVEVGVKLDALSKGMQDSLQWQAREDGKREARAETSASLAGWRNLVVPVAGSIIIYALVALIGNVQDARRQDAPQEITAP